MLFSSVLGQEFIKKHLTTSVDAGRIAHAQLFVGASGAGVLPMAIAYAQYILCGNAHGENVSGNDSCNLKFANLGHPDLHFVYPVATNTSGSKGVSKMFAKEWRSFVSKNPYGSQYEWMQCIGVEKKQGLISVHEAQDIYKSLSLKSYEGGYKVMIIWMAETMNTDAANKLLKLIEEPPNDTLLLLIAENEDQIIDTIRSRCQVLHFPNLPDEIIAQALSEKEQVEINTARKIARQAEGDFNKALHLLHHDGEDVIFEEWFITWVRTAFSAKGKKGAVLELISWAETIAKQGRETQKNFLSYCVTFFRQALLQNYGADTLVFLEPQLQFDLKKFAPFIHGKNIVPIVEAVQDASYHIERNANAKVVFTDLSLQLTRLLHAKAH